MEPQRIIDPIGQDLTLIHKLAIEGVKCNDPGTRRKRNQVYPIGILVLSSIEVDNTL